MIIVSFSPSIPNSPWQEGPLHCMTASLIGRQDICTVWQHLWLDGKISVRCDGVFDWMVEVRGCQLRTRCFECEPWERGGLGRRDLSPCDCSQVLHFVFTKCSRNCRVCFDKSLHKTELTFTGKGAGCIHTRKGESGEEERNWGGEGERSMLNWGWRQQWSAGSRHWHVARDKWRCINEYTTRPSFRYQMHNVGAREREIWHAKLILNPNPFH